MSTIVDDIQGHMKVTIRFLVEHYLRFDPDIFFKTTIYEILRCFHIFTSRGVIYDSLFFSDVSNFTLKMMFGAENVISNQFWLYYLFRID